MNRHKLLSLLVTASLIGLDQMAIAVETSLTFDAQFQWTELGVKADNENNPDNMFLNLPTQRGLVELRPRFALDWETLSANIEPRLTYLEQKNDSNNDGEDETTIRYWELDWRSDNLAMSLSKTVKLWGPSVIFSPSNRYHRDNGSTSPNSELLAREFIETNWYISERWDLEFIANVGEGDQVVNNFETSSDVRINWIGEASNATTQISWLNPGWGIGGNIQWTVSDGLLIYVDGLYAPFTTVENTIAAITNTQLSTQNQDHHLRMVSGLSYTFENGFNIALDYFYNGSGYDGENSRRLLRQSNEAVSQLLQTGFDPNLASTVRGINTLPTFSLSKHYAVSRISQNNLWDRFSVAYILVENLDDHGRQHTVTVDCDCGDRLSVFANASIFSGDTLTEFGRFFASQMTIGFRWVLL